MTTVPFLGEIVSARDDGKLMNVSALIGGFVKSITPQTGGAFRVVVQLADNTESSFDIIPGPGGGGLTVSQVQDLIDDTDLSALQGMIAESQLPASVMLDSDFGSDAGEIAPEAEGNNTDPWPLSKLGGDQTINHLPMRMAWRLGNNPSSTELSGAGSVLGTTEGLAIPDVPEVVGNRRLDLWIETTETDRVKQFFAPVPFSLIGAFNVGADAGRLYQSPLLTADDRLLAEGDIVRVNITPEHLDHHIQNEINETVRPIETRLDGRIDTADGEITNVRTVVNEAFDDASISGSTLTLNRVDNANPLELTLPSSDDGSADGGASEGSTLPDSPTAGDSYFLTQDQTITIPAGTTLTTEMTPASHTSGSNTYIGWSAIAGNAFGSLKGTYAGITGIFQERVEVLGVRSNTTVVVGSAAALAGISSIRIQGHELALGDAETLNILGASRTVKRATTDHRNYGVLHAGSAAQIQILNASGAPIAATVTAEHTQTRHRGWYIAETNGLDTGWHYVDRPAPDLTEVYDRIQVADDDAGDALAIANFADAGVNANAAAIAALHASLHPSTNPDPIEPDYGSPANYSTVEWVIPAGDWIVDVALVAALGQTGAHTGTVVLSGAISKTYNWSASSPTFLAAEVHEDIAASVTDRTLVATIAETGGASVGFYHQHDGFNKLRLTHENINQAVVDVELAERVMTFSKLASADDIEITLPGIVSVTTLLDTTSTVMIAGQTNFDLLTDPDDTDNTPIAAPSLTDYDLYIIQHRISGGLAGNIWRAPYRATGTELAALTRGTAGSAKTEAMVVDPGWLVVYGLNASDQFLIGNYHAGRNPNGVRIIHIQYARDTAPSGDVGGQTGTGPSLINQVLYRSVAAGAAAPAAPSAPTYSDAAGWGNLSGWQIGLIAASSTVDVYGCLLRGARDSNGNWAVTADTPVQQSDAGDATIAFTYFNADGSTATASDYDYLLINGEGPIPRYQSSRVQLLYGELTNAQAGASFAAQTITCTPFDPSDYTQIVIAPHVHTANNTNISKPAPAQFPGNGIVSYSAADADDAQQDGLFFGWKDHGAVVMIEIGNAGAGVAAFEDADTWTRSYWMNFRQNSSGLIDAVVVWRVGSGNSAYRVHFGIHGLR